MSSLISNNYLANRPIEHAMHAFARRFTAAERVLDIGCGNKPYAPYFKCSYIGLDPDPQSQADVIGTAWELPFADNSFDGVILNQSLEHIAETTRTIAEVRRVLKSGGYAIITVPQTMKNHGVPNPAAMAPVRNFDTTQIPYWYVDYWRFTKYGLIYAFKDFTILSMIESTGYGGTLFQLGNYFLASLGIDWLLRPFYFINNVGGRLCDYLAEFLRNLNIPLITKVYDLVYLTLTINYIMVVRKPLV